jgi:AcrR family transcriptional regulator
VSYTAPDLRKDAARSRRIILDAAQSLLQIDLEASQADIARAAGIGRATVYRHFPVREDIVVALLDEALDRLEIVAGSEEGTLVLPRLLRAAAGELARCQGLIAVIRRGDDARERAERLRSRIRDLFRGPLDEAKKAGAVRDDLSVEEIPLLLSMVEGALSQVADPVDRGETSTRALEVVLQGVLSR